MDHSNSGTTTAICFWDTRLQSLGPLKKVRATRLFTGSVRLVLCREISPIKLTQRICESGLLTHSPTSWLFVSSQGKCLSTVIETPVEFIELLGDFRLPSQTDAHFQ